MGLFPFIQIGYLITIFNFFLKMFFPHHTRGLGVGHLSPRELYEGNLEGGLFYGEPRRIC